MLNDSDENYQSIRHRQCICIYGGFCVKFHNQQHIKSEIHPFLMPCPLTPYHCELHNQFVQVTHSIPDSTVKSHCTQYSHVCPLGLQCTDKTNLHRQTSIHIVRKICPYLDSCSLLTNEEHLNTFTHLGLRDIRLPCPFKNSTCPDHKNAKHTTLYQHSANNEYPSVILYFGLNEQINFSRNQYELVKIVSEYTNSHRWNKGAISADIINWIRALEPVHRCTGGVFESILIHGHVMSRHQMNLLRCTRFIAHIIQQHPEVRKIVNHQNNPLMEEHIRDLIRVLVDIEFNHQITKPAAKQLSLVEGPVNDHLASTSRIHDVMFKSSLADEDVKTIRQYTHEIIQTSLRLHTDPTGIGYAVDNALGTDRHVFTVLGPHLGHYYGDIFLVFKREIMFHPDSYVSIQAATTFGPSMNAYKFRPWLIDPRTPEKRIQQYHNTNLHCSTPGYEHAAATELIALTGLRKRTMNVDLNTIKKHWMNIDSHEIFEGHLPQLIPIDYIDHVYMPKNVFQSLTPKAQCAAKHIFGKSLTVTDDIVDLNHDLEGLDSELDATRIPYQKYVINEINSTLNHIMNEPSLLQGTVITLPATHFKEYVMLPMTISQSSYQDCRRKIMKDDNSTSILICWEAMRGDVMVTLSNAPIVVDHRQEYIRCLTCYVAEIPAMDDTNYRESLSYLSGGRLTDHDAIIRDRQFKASSNSFHRGCNTKDYISYCLRIDRQMGQVILSHVGSNKIYNRETIRCHFNKNELNLFKLEYVHISAGTQVVPVRNMIIRHESAHEWYQSYDELDSFERTDHLTTEQLAKWISTTVDLIVQHTHLLPVLIADLYESIHHLCDEKYHVCSNTHIRHSVNRHDILVAATVAERMATDFCKCVNECGYTYEFKYSLYSLCKLEDAAGQAACITILSAFGELTVDLSEIFVAISLEDRHVQDTVDRCLNRIHSVDNEKTLSKLLEHLKSNSKSIRYAASKILTHLTQSSIISMSNVDEDLVQIISDSVSSE